jgi:CheY-like chemotaxis protein
MASSVLVVDDEDVIRMVMRTILEDAGYAVIEASDGKPALAQLADSQEGMVVVLDLKMPGMDGIAVLRALANDEQLANRHAVIVASALDSQNHHVDVVQLLIQMDARLLERPFDIDELVEAVRAAEQRLTPLSRFGALGA